MFVELELLGDYFNRQLPAAMSRRTLHFAAPGFKTQLIEIAPDAEDPRSKRHEIIKNEDDLLNKNLDDLEEGTKARNRAFQNRLVRLALVKNRSHITYLVLHHEG